MSELSSIVNVSIQLNATAVSGESFGNLLIVGPRPAAWSDWAATTAYLVGNIVVSGTHVYSCTVAGTSGSVAPTHTSGTATDGTVTWQYKQEVPAPVGAYSTLNEVSDAGWVTTGDSQDPVGTAARIAFSQSPRPNKVFIAVQQYSNSVLETVVTTLDRAVQTSGWYVVTTAGIAEASFEDVAEWTEAQTKLFVYTYIGANDPVGDTYFRSAGYFGKQSTAQLEADVPAANKYLGIAAAIKCLSYESGQETWAFKTLAAVNPAELTTTEANALEADNLNWYETVAGVNITRNGKVKAGEWIDIIRFRDWLQNDMSYRIINLLIKRPKVPFTNAGIGLVENQMIASLKSGVAAGGICPDEYDSKGNLVPGFTVSVPNASQITDSQKASRTLSGCTFEANIAGAIHVIKISGALVYPN